MGNGESNARGLNGNDRIKSTSAVESASASILEIMERDGDICANEALALLRKYELACDTVTSHFPGN